MTRITRRDLLSGACAAGAASLVGGVGRMGAAAGPAADEPFTFVHLTDTHVTRKRQGERGYRACIESIRQLRPAPAFVLMGGDMAFDGCTHTKAEFEKQIHLFKEGIDALGVRWYPCVGNHDVLGWSSGRKVAADDPEIGKKMIMDRLGWEKSYYSFDHAGWHVVVLDCIYPVSTADGPSYRAMIGREQLEWLAYDLGAAAGRPTVAVTHIAAFCANHQIAGDPDCKGLGRVIEDTVELRTILERHQVKALLQGHSHRIEEYRLNGVWYLSSAAGGGAWWAGAWVGSPPGYTVFRCAGDQLSWSHHSFPWEPHLEPEDNLERKLIAEQEAFVQEQQRLLALEQAGERPWPDQQHFMRR